MKIEISESAPVTPEFPAFYKDGEGDLWLWVDECSLVCFNGPFIQQDSEFLDVNFHDYNDEHKFVRVHGTITITV